VQEKPAAFKQKMQRSPPDESAAAAAAAAGLGAAAPAPAAASAQPTPQAAQAEGVPVVPTNSAATPAAAAVAAAAAAPPKDSGSKPKKFLNGWTRQLEQLAAEWADKSACYKWMHERSDLLLSHWNMIFTIPVILLSTITGTANFGVQSLLPDPSYGKYANAAIGGISLLAGMISTIANFLRYAQASEAHRVAGISWGKFQRFISTELALHPNERMDAMGFLKMARVELDRLIEQSPNIPRSIIRAFEYEFKKKPEIHKPEIVGGLEHTKFFDDKESRLARVAADAAMMLGHKKKFLSEMVRADLDKQIAERVKAEREAAEATLLEELTRRARDAALRTVRAELAAAGSASVQATPAKTPMTSPSAGAPAPAAAPAPANTVQLRPPSPREVTLLVTEENGVPNLTPEQIQALIDAPE
jgi:hypothetical protein